MKNQLKVALAFVGAVAVGFVVMLLIKTYGQNSIFSFFNKRSTNTFEVHDTPSKDDVVTGQEEKILDIVNETNSFQASPELNVSDVRIRLVVGKNEYYYIVSGINAGDDANEISFTLSDDYGHIYTSIDGSFPNVAANKAGTYSAVATSASGLSSDAKLLKGFNIVQPVANRLTAGDLSSLFATGDYDGCKTLLEGKLAKNVVIKCTDTEYKCNTIPEVFMSVGLENWAVIVTSVEYNCLGQVSCIRLSVQK